jgi:hypothetical protein
MDNIAVKLALGTALHVHLALPIWIGEQNRRELADCVLLGITHVLVIVLIVTHVQRIFIVIKKVVLQPHIALRELSLCKVEPLQ